MCVDIEKDKINLDKRDNQTMKAQLAFQQNQFVGTGFNFGAKWRNKPMVAYILILFDGY